MSEKENKLAAEMLRMASDEFSNHSCNDVSDYVWDGWTQADREKFVLDYHIWNGDPENFERDNLHIPDYSIMSYLAYRIEQKSESKL